MKTRRILRVLSWLSVSFLVFASASWAAESDVDRLIDLLIRKGTLTKDEASEFRADLAIKNQEEEKEKKFDLKAKYKDGFKLETKDQEFSIGIGGRFHGDGRFYLDDNHPKADTFLVRRARIYLTGNLYKYFNFKVEKDFGEGKSTLTDAYFEANHIPELVFRAGQFKEPFGLEQNTSSNYMDFIERPLVDNLVPARDIGAMLHGSLFQDRINYGLGVFNGNGSNKDTDSNDDKDVAARLVVSPFLGWEGSPLKGLHLGGAATYGHQDKFDSDFTVRSEARTTFFKINSADKINFDKRIRLGSELAWIYGPLSLKSEYVKSLFTDVQKQGTNVEGDMDLKAWYITLGYFLTGEEKAWKNGVFQRTKPKENFNPFKGGWGAWEVLFRYSQFGADKAFIQNGIVKKGSNTDGANAYTLGLNWYLNPMVTFKLNYVHTKFDDDIPGKDGQRLKDEDVLMTRLQIVF